MDTDTLPYRPCAGVLLARPDGMIFAGERLDTIGAWQMPQGGIDPGETPQDAALRELWEETGVKPDLVTIEAQTRDWVYYDFPPELIHKVAKGKYRGQKQHWFLMRFQGTDADIEIHTDHQEFGRWQWMSADALVAGIVVWKRDVYSQVIDQFRESL